MRGMSESTKILIRYARQLLAEDHPQTLRQLHYAIFSKNAIDYQNDRASYRRLSSTTTKARRTYRAWELAGATGEPPEFSIPPERMIDETRAGEVVSLWRDAREYVETVKRSYRRNNWTDQDFHIEVWSEKATVLGALRPVAHEWGVTLRVCHGFGSTGMEGEVGRLFEGIDKPIKVLFMGDHDASGHDIQRDIHRRVEEASGITFSMVRLAIHGEDIGRFNLPPQRIKESDSRAASFRKKFGQDAATVELDALPAVELRRRVEEAVTSLIDFDKWGRQVAVQELELRCIRDFADRVKNLPQVEART